MKTLKEAFKFTKDILIAFVIGVILGLSFSGFVVYQLANLGAFK